MMLEQVTILTVTYNSAAVLPDFFASLPTECPLIISDNNSTDETCATASALAPNALLLQHPQNLGYGTAANRALTRVNTPFALLLNPDTILQTNTIPSLLRGAEQFPQHAIFGGQLLDSLGNPAVSYKPPLFSPKHRLFKPIVKIGSQKRRDIPPAIPTPCGWICGAAMFFRMDALQKIGFFDEEIFLYFEETDLCFRAVQAGMQPIFVPEATLVHRGGCSTTTGIESSNDWKHYTLEVSRYYLAQKYPNQIAPWISIFYRYYYGLKWAFYRLCGNQKGTNLYAARLKAAKGLPLS